MENSYRYMGRMDPGLHRERGERSEAEYEVVLLIPTVTVKDFIL